MDFIESIINWFLRFFGRKAAKAAIAAGTERLLSSSEKQQIRNNAVQGLEDVQGAENIHVFGTGDGARVVRSEKGADLVEEGGKQQWVERIDTHLPRERWVDEWGPLKGESALDDFLLHERIFDQTRSGDPLGAEQKLKEFGYQSVGHFFYVRTTILKHFGTPHGPTLGESVFESQAYQSAGLRAAQRVHELEMQAKLKSNPELLAPVEGVTVELYAEICARIAQNIPPDQLLALLASHQLDMPAWERANKVWTDRMSKDATATIATIYGKAFMNTGHGQFGAAGQAAAATNWNGGAAGGAEPIPFEKMCEIAGAMSAWAKTGKDVNALLQSQFGMNAMDYSQVSTWWMTQMMARLEMFDTYNRKMAEYEQKYSGPVQRFDQDLQF
jgi:hypothetical protein